MVEVRLFKESAPSIKNHGYATETIHGIQLPDREPIFFHGRFTSTPESNQPGELESASEVLDMREEAAERLAKFCLDHLQCEDGVDDFSCKTFVDYVGGFSDQVESLATFRRDYHVSDPAESMESGRPYVATSDTKVLHAMLGTKRPTHGLSITANGMPLEIIDVNTMHKMYKSHSVRLINNSVPSKSLPNK